MNDLKRVLRAAGYRATPARQAVLAVLTEEQKPVNLRRLIAKARRHRPMDPVTVYRTVSALCNAGMVRQIDFRHGYAHYELTNREEHHHVICTGCDRVEDVTGCRIETMTVRVLRETKFNAITDHALEFFGRCQRCARRQR